MINIVIADDHQIFREGLISLIDAAKDMCVVGSASDGNEAFLLILEKIPHVAILDITMPEMTGIDVAKEVYRRGLPTRILILTMHRDYNLAQDAFKSGVSGYILKENAFDDLVYAIKTVHSGKVFISPSLTDRMVSSEEKKEPDKTVLSEREQEVLRLISSGLTNKQIGERLFISVKTVETHRHNIMDKLDIHNTAELVRYAIKIGLVK